MNEFRSYQSTKDICIFREKVFTYFHHFLRRFRCEKLAKNFIFLIFIVKQFAIMACFIGASFQSIVSWMSSWSRRIIARLKRIIINFFAGGNLNSCFFVGIDRIRCAKKFFIVADLLVKLRIAIWYNQWDNFCLIAWNIQEFCRYSIRLPRGQHYLANLCFNIFGGLDFKIVDISRLIVHSHLEHHANEALSYHFKLKIADVSSEKFLSFTYICLHK